MKVYSKNSKSEKYGSTPVPNTIAYGFIRNFLTDKQYRPLREEYLIGNLSSKQVNQAMVDIKWLFKNYKGLDVITIENPNGSVSKFIL